MQADSWHVVNGRKPPSASTPRIGIDEDRVDERLLERPAQALRAEAQLARKTSVKQRADAERTHERAMELRQQVRRTGAGQRSTRRASVQEFALILEEDPELAAGLPPEAHRAATDLLRAAVLAVNRSRWEPPTLNPRTTYGLLLLDGLVGRRVRVGRAVATELLGCGDILRPWEEPCRANAIPPTIDWRVFCQARMAVLDERVTKLICQRPELAIAFSGRLLRRVRYAEYMMAIAHMPRVEDKLRATFRHLASNWGRVTPEGVTIPFRLTHEVLGEIIGAQRPSVTMAMRQLRDRCEVARSTEGGYILRGELASWRAGELGLQTAKRSTPIRD